MTTPNPNAVAKQQPQQNGIRAWLGGDALKAQLAQVLPKHLSPERQARVAMTALTRTPKLAECDPASFFQCLLSLSQFGLEPDGRHAHLIPFENRRRGVIECQLIIDYKGLVELANRSGKVANIHADTVCDNDEFEFDRGEIKRHKIDFRKPRGAVYAVYALCRFKDGTEKCEVMTREDVDSIRKRSKAGNSGPWVTDWNEMAKKTAFRRLSKWLPLSPEFRDAVDADDDVIDTTAQHIATSALEAPKPEAKSKSEELAALFAKSMEAEPSTGEESQEAPQADAGIIEFWQQKIDSAKTSIELELQYPQFDKVRGDMAKADGDAIEKLFADRLKTLGA